MDTGLRMWKIKTETVDLLKRESLRQDVMLAKGEGDSEDDVLLPWDKNEEV